MAKIKVVAKDLHGFDEEVAQNLLQKTAEVLKHYWKHCEREAIRDGWAKKGYAKEHYTEDLERLKVAEEQEYQLKEYATIRNAILEKRLVVQHIGGLYWTTKYIEDNKICPVGIIRMKALCPYRLNYNKVAYFMSCYGTSRPLEIILSYGYRLGLKFDEIPQQQQII